ncbi:unnamed protein product [Sphenostylis stenocarpa]|uniref:Uncharacterized protein n=1 Tax=Sphenostylis stenocarpa TaxID=92480 RepID=A0AA86SMZ7_9FABA|nr:unnamed protein product [Sphenostylis stenocarpa]
MSWEGAAKWVVGINGKKDDRCNTRTSREVTHPSTTLAQARLTAEFDGIRCISLGMIAPASVARSMVIWIRRHTTNL